LVKFHREHGKLATMTAAHPAARFGQIVLKEERVIEFAEKPQTGEGWINGGFFVLQPEIVRYIDDDQTIWERKPMEQLAADGQLIAYRHNEFWQCMDTLRDVQLLNKLWMEGNAPWKI